MSALPPKLLVWSSDQRTTVLSGLSLGLRLFKDLDIDVVKELPPPVPGRREVVFALGGKPFDALKQLGVVPKNFTITGVRERYDLKLPDGRQLLVSFSPGIKEIDYEQFGEFLCDGVSAVRYAATGAWVPPVPSAYQWVEDFSSLIASIEAEFAETGKPVAVAFDSETQNHEPWSPDSRFVTLQFTHKPGTAVVKFIADMAEERAILTDAKLMGQLKWLFTTPKVQIRAANGKYDFVWLWVRYQLECTNFKLDTNLSGNLLDENRSNSLDVHAKLYTGMGGYSDYFDRTVDKSQMQLIPKGPDLLGYAGGDTDACQQVAEAVRVDLLKDKPLTSFYVNILHPASRSFEVLERTGVHIDRERFKELEADCIKELTTTAQEAAALIGTRLFAAHRNEEKPGGLDLTSAALITDYMFGPRGLNLTPIMLTEKTKKPSTAWEHLKQFKGVPEAKAFLALQERNQQASKTLSTFVGNDKKGFLKHLRADNRFHASYFLSKSRFDDDSEGGAVTGRLSAKNPAMQVVPKHTDWAPRIRRCFTAPDGYVIVERDFNQGELRVVACISSEPTMLQAYKEGKDLHALTGARIAHMTYEQVMALKKTDKKAFDLIRQPAKPANFGLLYGQGPEGFQRFAELNYNVIMELSEATEIHNVFFQMYGGLLHYHEDFKKFAHKHGYVRSPLGRIRHLPLIHSRFSGVRSKAERQAINSPVQSTLSDMMLWALAIEWQMGLQYIAPPFAAIHDATYDYVPEDKVYEIAKKKKEIMENLPFEKVGWKPQLTFIADVKAGKDMNSLEEIKFAA